MGAAVALPRPDAAEELRQAWRAALRPEEPLTVAEWAERYRRLDGKSASEPGKWRNARTPYLVKIMETLSTASRAELVIFQKGSQIGATETGNNWLGYIIDHAPGPALAVWPTVDVAKRNSLQRVDALIDSTPRLVSRVAPARERDSGNTRLMKEFPGGMLVITGANSAASLKSTPARYLFLDEVDEYPVDLGRQGSAVTLAMRATRTYRRRRKVFMASTPTREGVSRIDQERRKAEQEWRYHVPCPACGHLQELVWDRMRYTVPPPGKSDQDGVLVEIPDVTYECAGCQHRIAEHYKQQLLAQGAWVCIRNRGDRSVAFHLSALYSPPGWFGWGEAAAMYERAKQQPTEMQPFQNTVLGLPYADAHDAPAWQPLFDRREAYVIGTVPPGVRFLTMAVDVQRDRLEVEVKGWGREHQSWSVVHEVLPGDPNQPVVWGELDRLLHTEWPCHGGGTLPIWCCAVDSGDLTQHVYAWARRHTAPAFGGQAIAVRHPRTVLVVKGRNIWGRILLPPEKAGAEERQRGLRVVGVGVSGVKRELYTWLRGVVADGTAPHGYLHYPAYEERFFQQLTAERMVVRVRHGYPTEYWEKDPGARNEALDLAVYNRAAAAACGIDRFTDRHWLRMEKQLPAGLLAPPVVPGAAVPPERPALAMPVVAPPPRPALPRRRVRSRWMDSIMRGRPQTYW